MYIMPQHMQWNIYLCKTIVFPLWPQKNMDESVNDKGHTSWKRADLCCYTFQWQQQVSVIVLSTTTRKHISILQWFQFGKANNQHSVGVVVLPYLQVEMGELIAQDTLQSLVIDFDAIKIIHMELVQVKQYTNKTHDTKFFLE